MTKRSKKRTASTEVAQPYEPTEREQNAMSIRKSRRNAAMPHPRLKVTNTEANSGIHAEVAIDHKEASVGWDVLVAGLGLSDPTAAGALIDHISFVAQRKDGVSQNAANQLLAVVQEIAPQDPIEALLAVQMATIHEAAMKQGGLLNTVMVLGKFDRFEGHSNALNKLSRTFAAQMEALKRYRSKGVQKVVVEHQHIHVHPGAQAVVGDVYRQGVGEQENGGQPLERETMRLPERSPMLREVQANRVPMPGASGEGADCVPFPRSKGRATNG